MDVNRIKEEAHGRWSDILTSLTGVSPESLDPRKHGPCPKCGGTDRFRAMKDFEETGGVICNQCFSEKNGDGIATYQWLAGISFKDAIAALGGFLGIESEKSKKINPEKNLEFQPWNDALALAWTIGKKPIKVDALKKFGCRIARYRNEHTVMAVPITDAKRKICGWIIYAIGNGMLPKFTKGKPPEWVKVKMTAGSTQGLVAPLEEIESATEIWKVEGPTDAMAFMSASEEPDVIAICNSNGATEKPQGWMVSLFEGKTARVLHDADEPGETGAKLWVNRLADNCNSVTHVRLPYDVQPTKGKDLRDWLNEGNDFRNLLGLAQNTKDYEPERTKEGLKLPDAAEISSEEKRLLQLGIVVLYEKDSNQVVCYSRLQRKTFTIRDLSRLSKEHLIQFCGAIAKDLIVRDPGCDEEMTITQARESIAIIAASLRSDKVTECGHGVWMGKDLTTGDSTNTILLVGGGESARFNGDKILRQVFEPRIDGLVLDMSDRRDWYQFDRLRDLVAQADSIDWRRGVFAETESMFSQCHWSRPNDSMLLTGLIFAAWVQSIWDWRPLVSISGASKSGKSTVFDKIELLFGDLCWRKEKPTEAGIRQSIRNSSRIIMLDEFERDKHRQRIWELLRTSSRGGTVVRGSASQKAEEFGLRHISFVAGIETGLTQAADQNRTIQFELQIPEKEKYRKWKWPKNPELKELGNKILACAIVCARDAYLISKQLIDECDSGDTRQLECYAAPSAMIASIQGVPTKVWEIATEFMSEIDQEEIPENDEDSLFDDIMAIEVDFGGGRKKSVSHALSSYSDIGVEEVARLESIGLKVHERNLYVVHQLVRKRIERFSRVDQVLLRIPNTQRCRLRVNGMNVRGVLIPEDYLEKRGLKIQSRGF